MVVTEGVKKTAVAEVRLYQKGSGVVTVNGRSILREFPTIQSRSVYNDMLFACTLCSSHTLVKYCFMQSFPPNRRRSEIL